MTKSILLSTAVLLNSLAPAIAQTAPENWGQEVKECNQSSCYAGGTSRGAYVGDQARDDEGPGYGSEIHRLADPGNSEPQGAPNG